MKRHVLMLAAFLTLLTACQTTDRNSAPIAYNDLVLSADGQDVTLPGSDILNVKLLIDPAVEGGYKIIIVLSQGGTSLFANLTEKTIDKKLSISASGRAILSARVVTPVVDGRIVVSGYQRDEAKRIVDALVKKTDPAQPPQKTP